MKRENDSDIETRCFPAEFRAIVAAEDSEAPRIEGTAAVYNSWSEDLGGYREMIEPGFFDEVLKDDVRALWNHNPDYVLGRNKAKTLMLNDTERGLDVSIIPPDTQMGRDTVTSIRRGDVDQMSFAFSVKENGDEWSRDKDGTIRRVLKRGGAGALYDVSPVTYPAYTKTSVSVRSKLETFTQAAQVGETEACAKASAQARNANRKRKIQILAQSVGDKK